MDKIVKVTGEAKIAVKPDTIRLSIDLDGTQERYEEVLRQSSQAVETLKTCFQKLGFERTDLKTVSFQVNTKYESYQSVTKDWKERFVGYEFKHILKIEFHADNQMLGKVLYEMAHSSVEPKFHIFYTVKDAEPAKNLLLAKAVKDATEKAKVLAEAAGVTLGEVAFIDYSWEEMEIISRPMNLMASRCMESDEAVSYNVEMEPEDIKVSDHVTVSWHIL